MPHFAREDVSNLEDFLHLRSETWTNSQHAANLQVVIIGHDLETVTMGSHANISTLSPLHVGAANRCIARHFPTARGR